MKIFGYRITAFPQGSFVEQVGQILLITIGFSGYSVFTEVVLVLNRLS